MSKVAVMDVNPARGVASESPLAMSKVKGASAASTHQAGVVVRERAFLGHLILRGDANSPGFREGVERALGLALPQTPCRLEHDEASGASIQWMSPDEWLIIVPGGAEFAIERALRANLEGHFAVINVSGGQTVLELTGPAVRAMLMKCTPYDVHPRAFPVGKGVGTAFAKSTANIRRVAEARWELVIRRSFADYLYRWLLDAGEEFGVCVAAGGQNKRAAPARPVREAVVEAG